MKGFRGHLICTSVTARWVSKLEGAQDRAKMDAGLIEKPVRPFQATLNTTQLVRHPSPSMALNDALTQIFSMHRASWIT